MSYCFNSSRSIHCAEGLFVSKLEACCYPFMLSVQPMLTAMDAVTAELEVHFHHLAKPQLDASDREAIGARTAESVRRGFTVMALHQLMFNLQLDELEEQALVVHN